MDDENFQRESPRRAGRFQFSLLTIFIVLTVSAAIAALIRAIPFPPFARYFAATYLIILGIPLLLRMPHIIRILRTYSSRMRQLDEERARLLKSARQRQQQRRGELAESDTIKE